MVRCRYYSKRSMQPVVAGPPRGLLVLLALLHTVHVATGAVLAGPGPVLSPGRKYGPGRPTRQLLIDIPGVSANNSALAAGVRGFEGQLAARVFRNAIHSKGDVSQWGPLLEKVRGGEEVRVLGIGSSILSEAGGCTEAIPVVAHLCPDCCGAYYGRRAGDGGWLLGVPRALQREVRPGARVRVQNMGRPALSLQELVECPTCWFHDWRRVDLFVLDFGVTLNPGWLALFERLLRMLLQMPQRPAVLFVDMFEFCATGNMISPDNHDYDHWVACHPPDVDWAVVPMKLTTPRANSTLPAQRQEALESLAEHYGLPVLSWRAAVYEEVAAGRLTLEDISRDGTHPTEGGARLLQGVVEYYLATVVSEAGGAGSSQLETASWQLPAALTKKPGRLEPSKWTVKYGFRNWEWGNLANLYMARQTYNATLMTDQWFVANQSKASTVQPNNLGQHWPTMPYNDGWTLQDWDGDEATGVWGRTTGMLANRSGAVLGLELDTRPTTEAQQAEGAAFVLVRFLESNQRLGKVRLSCGSSEAGPGCSCGEAVVDAHNASLTRFKGSTGRWEAAGEVLLEGVTMAPACLLKLQVLEETSSGDHTFKLLDISVGFHKRPEEISPPAAPPCPPPPPPPPRLVPGMEGVYSDNAAFQAGIPGFEGQLAARVFNNSLPTMGDPGMLRGVAARARAGRAVRVFAIGSSITMDGGGCTAPLPEVAPLCPLCCGSFYSQAQEFDMKGAGFLLPIAQALRRAVGAAAEVEILNAGRPISGPADLMECPSCWHRHLDQVDLFVIEWGVIVSPGERGTSQVEQVVRFLRGLPQRPAVLFVNFFMFCDNSGRPDTTVCRPNGAPRSDAMAMTTAAGEAAGPAQQNAAIERVADHYGLPLVSLRRAVFDEIAQGAMKLESLTDDGTHPNPGGSRLVGGLVDRLFTLSLRHLAGAAGAAAAPSLELPEQLVSGGQRLVPVHSSKYAYNLGDVMWNSLLVFLQPGGMTRSQMAAALNKHSEATFDAQGAKWPTQPRVDKWRYNGYDIPADSDQDWMTPSQPGMVAVEAGAVLQVRVDTRPYVPFDGGAPAAALWLWYMKFREAMGRVQVKCVEGCTCEGAELEGAEEDSPRPWQARAQITGVSVMEACTVQFTVLAASNTTGHRFKLFRMAVGFNLPPPPLPLPPAAATDTNEGGATGAGQADAVVAGGTGATAARQVDAAAAGQVDLTPDLTPEQIAAYHDHVKSKARGSRFGIV